jgi:hypothetical protein
LTPKSRPVTIRDGSFFAPVTRANVNETSRNRSTHPSSGPALGDAGQTRAAEREARRAAALRANLTRRKAQSRTRDGAAATGLPADAKPSLPSDPEA